MSKSSDEQISLMNELTQLSESIAIEAMVNNNFSLIPRNANAIADNYFSTALLKWRKNDNPTNDFRSSVEARIKWSNILTSIDNGSTLPPLDEQQTIYAGFFCGIQQLSIDLNILGDNTTAAGFFGNVIIGADDIANWSKYRGLLPQGKRYDLARQTNELYAGLLAGSISHEDGVKLGEQLWAEREDHPYFDTGTGGYGDDNENMVDYQLGAILKKIGSTVPTVHAWRW